MYYKIEPKDLSSMPEAESHCACSQKKGNMEKLLCKGPMVWKRAIDITGAFIGLILLFPLFILIALFVKSVFQTEPGGARGKDFQMFEVPHDEAECGCRKAQKLSIGIDQPR